MCTPIATCPACVTHAHYSSVLSARALFERAHRTRTIRACAPNAKRDQGASAGSGGRVRGRRATSGFLDVWYWRSSRDFRRAAVLAWMTPRWAARSRALTARSIATSALDHSCVSTGVVDRVKRSTDGAASVGSDWLVAHLPLLALAQVFDGSSLIGHDNPSFTIGLIVSADPPMSRSLLTHCCRRPSRDSLPPAAACPTRAEARIEGKHWAFTGHSLGHCARSVHNPPQFATVRE